MKKAIFIGWQELDGEKPIALFNVETSDKQYPHGTTVDVKTLVEWDIRVPIYPIYETWANNKVKLSTLIKEIKKAYQSNLSEQAKYFTAGFDHSQKSTLPAIERAAELIRQGRIVSVEHIDNFAEAEAILLDEIRRIKNLPF